MSQGRNQDVTAAYGNGAVYYFTGDNGANVMTARLYGKGAIVNRSGQTTTADVNNPFNRAFLESGRAVLATFGGTYTPNAANATSVTAAITIPGGNANASMSRDTRYKQTPSTQLPSGTYRARVSTTGEMATMSVDGSGGFTLNTPNNCRITGVSNAAPITGTAGAGVRMDASSECFSGAQAAVSMSGIGLIGASNARLLIGGNDTSNAFGLAISAERTADAPSQPSTFPNKLVGFFTSDSGRVLTIFDDNEQLTALGAQAGNPSLFTFVVTGRVNFNGTPSETTGSINSTFTGNGTAYSAEPTFTTNITGQFSSPRTAPTAVGAIRLTMLRPGGQIGFVLGTADIPSLAGVTYSYNQPASLAAAAGRYSTREFLGGPVHNFTISSAGALTGTLGTCRMSGQLTPRSKNLFDVVVNFGSATEGCSNTMVAGQSVVGQTYRGISVITNDAETSHIFALTNTVTNRAYGVRMAKCGTSTVC